MKVFLFALLLAMASYPKEEVSQIAQKPQVVNLEQVPTSESERILYYANKYTYVRETNGFNRNPEIDLWNKYSNAEMGSPYCSSFVSYIYKLAGVKGPRSAWSPDQTEAKNVKFSEIKGGDAFGMWFSSKGRIAHTGFVKKSSGNLIYTIEANTSPDASNGSSKDREGDGVFNKIRSKTLMGNPKNKYSRYWK